MAQQKSLVLTFIKADGKKASMTLSDPKADLTADTVKTMMEKMAASTVFKSGDAIFTKAHMAQLVTREVADLYVAAN
ncbi:MAG: DUF2922 domain-containing protein [Clostridiales bacterium]|nr:DUF2922 domain-containing protein [Clostridiales bacterium]